MKVAHFGLAVAEPALKVYWVALMCRIAVPDLILPAKAPQSGTGVVAVWEHVLERIIVLCDFLVSAALFLYWQFVLPVSGTLLLFGLTFALGGLVWGRSR